MDLWQTFKIIRRRKWAALATAFVALVLVVVGGKFYHKTVRFTPMYSSGSKILLTPQGQSGNVNAPASLTMWFSNETILNELIKSEELLTRVAKRLPEGGTTWEGLRGSITIKPITSVGLSLQLFMLEVISTSPELAKQTSMVLAEEFVNYVQEISAREFANNRRFIESMVTEAVEQRDQAEAKMIAMREKYMSSKNEEAVQVRKSELRAQRLELLRKVSETNTQISALESFLTGAVTSPPWTVLEQREGTLSGLQAALSEQRLEVVKLQQIYTAESAKLKDAQRQLQETEELYNKEVSTYANALRDEKRSELQQHQQSLALVEQQLNELVSSEMTVDERRRLAKLQNELSVWENNHLTLLQQLYQARVAEQSSKRQGSVTILERPRDGSMISGGPVVAAYNPVRTAAMALPVCLLVGFLVAFGLDHLSSSMRLKPRIEETLDLPVITVIPPVSPELAAEWETFKKQHVVDVAESLILARQLAEEEQAEETV